MDKKNTNMLLFIASIGMTVATFNCKARELDYMGDWKNEQ